MDKNQPLASRENMSELIKHENYNIRNEPRATAVIGEARRKYDINEWIRGELANEISSNYYLIRQPT